MGISNELILQPNSEMQKINAAVERAQEAEAPGFLLKLNPIRTPSCYRLYLPEGSHRRKPGHTRVSYAGAAGQPRASA